MFVRIVAIISANADLLCEFQLDSTEENPLKIASKFEHFRSRKCT